jgi:predicted transposase YbfD/YdcC
MPHKDVSTFLDDPAAGAITIHTTVDAGHGRIETRAATISTSIGWLQEHHHWPGLQAIGKIVRTRETGAKTTTETAYYLISATLSAERFGQVVRAHWAVENNLHWTLDVIMNVYRARNRHDNGPNNLEQRLSRQPPRSKLKCDCPGPSPGIFRQTPGFGVRARDVLRPWREPAPCIAKALNREVLDMSP